MRLALWEGTSWQAHAECAKSDIEFFPEEFNAARVYQESREVCAVCPVDSECLAYALRRREQHGMWGGKTPGEREQLIRQIEQLGDASAA